MRYFGGKTKTCKGISQFLESVREPGQKFLSPFIGGGWVECLVKDPKFCSDKHNYLIAMYQKLQAGWLPPTALTREEYEYIKNHKDEAPHLTGFVGFGCSFAGKWFGGYASQSEKRNFCMNARNSILRKMVGLKGVQFKCQDYRDINPSGFLIYCDPPYRGATQYDRQIVGDFDHDEFWEDMRVWGKKNTVVVSEYSAPEDFKCVWSCAMRLDMRDKNNEKHKRIERLFTPNDIRPENQLFG